MVIRPQKTGIGPYQLPDWTNVVNHMMLDMLNVGRRTEKTHEIFDAAIIRLIAVWPGVLWERLPPHEGFTSRQILAEQPIASV